MRALILVCLTACGGAPIATAPARAELPAATPMRYAPLAAKADAKLPTAAVIFGTDEKDGSMRQPLPGTPDEVRVGRFDLTLAPARGDGAMQIGGADDQTSIAWRASAWRAAFAAAGALGKDVTDFTVSAGPANSASPALVAAALLAAATGRPVAPGVAIVGTVYTDGTIGPNEDMVAEARAALDGGAKRLGYPACARTIKSLDSGEEIDFVQLAASHHADAVALGDVRDAAALATGTKLPAPLPVPEADMALDAMQTAALEAAYREWQKRLAIEWASVLQLQQAGRLTPTLAAVAKIAQERGESAEALRGKGQLPAAFMRAVGAWIYAAGATQASQILAKVQAGDLAGADAAIAALDTLDADTDRAIEQAGTAPLVTIGDALRSLATIRTAVRSQAYVPFAQAAAARARELVASLKGKSAAELGSPQLADQVVGALAPAVLLNRRVAADAAAAQQELAFEAAGGPAYAVDPAAIARLAASYEAAADAGVDAFEAIVVSPSARRLNIAPEIARQRVALHEPLYLEASSLAHLDTSAGSVAERKARWGESSAPWALLLLAARELAYEDAAMLSARFESLGVHTNPQGRVEALTRQDALAPLLAAAERTARANARAARAATGAIPVRARLLYQVGQSERSGDLDDQLDALAQLWGSSVYSRVAATLARNAR
ncbi:MAG TPA: hypothetical protein VGM88_30590 [Kofleriaceae bacterium]|jgi:hypothetical protein